MAVTGSSVASALFLQSEKIAPKLESWLPKFTSRVFTKIKDKNVQRMSERDYRIPFKLTNGGKVGTYDPNMGGLGRGSSATGGVMISTWFPLRLNFELSELETIATEDKEKAIKSKFKMAMADAMPEFALYLDKFWNRGDGTALLATMTAQTVSTNTTCTLDTTYGTASLRVGMPVRVIATNMSTYRTIDTTLTETVILSIDEDNNQCVIQGAVDSPAATDRLILAGSSGSSPLGMKGLSYYHSYATSGTTLGVNRANVPEIITPSVNAAGGLTNTQGIQLLGKMMKRRNGEFPQGLFGTCSFERFQDINNQVQQVQRVEVSGDSAKMKDLVPGVDMEFKWCGVQHSINIFGDKTRIDWVNAANWGWTSMKPMSFYEVGDIRFFPIYASDGSPAAGLWFGLTVHRDSFCTDPASGGIIYGIS